MNFLQQYSMQYYSFWLFKTANRHSVRAYTLNSSKMSMKIFLENALNSSIEETLCFSLITLRHIQLDLWWKSIRFRLVCSTSSPIFTRRCSKWFNSFSFFTKCSEWKTLFSKKIRSKYSWKTSWAQNQMIFTSEESDGKMRFKIMANMVLIEINSSLNYLRIDYILLKRILFMTQPNIFIYWKIYIYIYIYSERERRGREKEREGRGKKERGGRERERRGREREEGERKRGGGEKEREEGRERERGGGEKERERRGREIERERESDRWEKGLISLHLL